MKKWKTIFFFVGFAFTHSSVGEPLGGAIIGEAGDTIRDFGTVVTVKAVGARTTGAEFNVVKPLNGIPLTSSCLVLRACFFCLMLTFCWGVFSSCVSIT